VNGTDHFQIVNLCARFSAPDAGSKLNAYTNPRCHGVLISERNRMSDFAPRENFAQRSRSLWFLFADCLLSTLIGLFQTRPRDEPSALAGSTANRQPSSAR